MDANDKNEQFLATFIPQKTYRPIMKQAMDRLGALDVEPEIVDMLFSKEELEWLKTQYGSKNDFK